MIKKILLSISILTGIIIVFFAVRMIIMMSAFGLFDKDYSITDLKACFNNKKNEIQELRQYFNKIVPTDRLVEIEFENKNTISRIAIQAHDTASNNNNTTYFQDWDLNIGSVKMDSLIQSLGWTNETLRTINSNLKKANCIGIMNGEPTKINFKRCGLGMYSFNVFERPISENLKDRYNDSCTFIYVDEYLVLEYGGGAVGPQCFYNLK